MVMIWHKNDMVIAQRFSKYEIPGFFSKKIMLRDNEFGVVIVNGQIYEVLTSGIHKICGLMDMRDIDVIFVDGRIKALKRSVSGLWTRDDKKIDADVEIRLRVSDAKRFVKNVVMERIDFMLDDLWEKIYTELLSKVFVPEVKNHDIEKLYGSREVLKRIEAGMDVEMRKTFELWGMDLISLSIIWRFPKEYELFLKERGTIKDEEKLEEVEHEKKLKEAEHSKEEVLIRETIEQDVNKEKKLAEIENERLEKEARIQLERLEEQKDMESALEGIELKNLNIASSPKKHDGGNENAGEIDKMIDEFKKMREVVEKKFLKKEIDEDVFKRIITNIDEKMAMLEAKKKG